MKLSSGIKTVIYPRLRNKKTTPSFPVPLCYRVSSSAPYTFRFPRGKRLGTGRYRRPGIKYLHTSRPISTGLLKNARTVNKEENVCAVGSRYLTTERAQRNLER